MLCTEIHDLVHRAIIGLDIKYQHLVEQKVDEQKLNGNGESKCSPQQIEELNVRSQFALIDEMEIVIESPSKVGIEAMSVQDHEHRVISIQIGCVLIK